MKRHQKPHPLCTQQTPSLSTLRTCDIVTCWPVPQLTLHCFQGVQSVYLEPTAGLKARLQLTRKQQPPLQGSCSPRRLGTAHTVDWTLCLTRKLHPHHKVVPWSLTLRELSPLPGFLSEDAALLQSRSCDPSPVQSCQCRHGRQPKDPD